MSHGARCVLGNSIPCRVFRCIHQILANVAVLWYISLLPLWLFMATEKQSACSGEVRESILRQVRSVAFPEGSPLLGPVHILDLDKEGYIKPHTDSVKFCGSTIVGLSLLSDSVMRLVPGNKSTDWVDLRLSRRSLYILRAEGSTSSLHLCDLSKPARLKEQGPD